MKDETLDDIEQEINQEETEQATAEAEYLGQEQQHADEARYQRCLEQGYTAMGFLRGAIAAIEPDYTLGGEEQEKAYIDQGASLHAAVLMLHDENAEMPEWLVKILPVIKQSVPYVMLGGFYIKSGFSVWAFKKAKAEAEAETEKEEKQEGATGGEKSE